MEETEAFRWLACVSKPCLGDEDLEPQVPGVPRDQPFPDWNGFNTIFGFGNSARINHDDFIIRDVSGKE